MKIKSTDRDNWKDILSSKSKYAKQKHFPALPNPYESRIQPIMHTGYLIFIRSKFLFLGLLKCIEDKNMHSSYAVLKSYWENVVVFGYYYLTIFNFLEANDKNKAFELARKMGLGGRGFLTEEIVRNKGHKIEDFKIPNIYTMMEKVDNDWKKILKTNDSIFRKLYDVQIAEGGHTTYISLSVGGKWLNDGSLLPDVRKCWDNEEKSSILNLMALSSKVDLYYWDKFQKIEEKWLASK